MTFAERQARLEEVVFRTFGEDATWTGAPEPVRVIPREGDEELRLDRGEVVVTGRRVRVRKSEVASPAEGQEVQILDSDGNPVSGELYAIAGEPLLDRKGVWHCLVRPL